MPGGSTGQLVDTVVFFKNAGTDTVDGSEKKTPFWTFFFAVVKNGDGSYTFSLNFFFPQTGFLARFLVAINSMSRKTSISVPGHGGLNHPVPIWYFQICTADSSAFLRQFPQFHRCATWKLLAFL